MVKSFGLASFFSSCYLYFDLIFVYFLMLLMPPNRLPVIMVVAAVLPILLVSVISLVDIFFIF